jgi:hypothetical protein
MRTCDLLVTIVAFLAVMAMPVYAAQVYVAAGEAGLVWGYADTVATVLNTGDPLWGITGMAIANDGQILISDVEDGIVELNPETGVITAIDSLSEAPEDVYPDCESDDIYCVTGSRTSYLWVLIGGVAPAQQCYMSSTAWDLQVYPMGERAGHVLILVGPADTLGPCLIELERTGPTTFEECPPVLVDIPGNPTGFALRPDGEIVLLDYGAGVYAVGAHALRTGPRPTQLGWYRHRCGRNHLCDRL